MNQLLQPFSVRGITAHNRLVLPPMAVYRADGEGRVTESLLAHYDEKTRGGYLGTVIVEHAFVSRQGKSHPRQLSAASDAMLPGLSRLAEVIHGLGRLAIAQSKHAGANTASGISGEPTVSPSGVPFGKRGASDRVLGEEELPGLVSDFVQAALRVQAAGFDGVELHSAHGYLLNQFCSPVTNRRRDAWGGDVSSRLHLHCQLIAAVRAAVGEGYPIYMRLGACDYVEGGNALPEALRMAELLSHTSLDVLDISGGLSGFRIPGREQARCYFEQEAAALRAVTALPVLLTGGITTLPVAETLLWEGCADLIGVGRAILEDSAWAEKEFQAYSFGM